MKIGLKKEPVRKLIQHTWPVAVICSFFGIFKKRQVTKFKIRLISLNIETIFCDVKVKKGPVWKLVQLYYVQFMTHVLK